MLRITLWSLQDLVSSVLYSILGPKMISCMIVCSYDSIRGKNKSLQFFKDAKSLNSTIKFFQTKINKIKKSRIISFLSDETKKVTNMSKNTL